MRPESFSHTFSHGIWSIQPAVDALGHDKKVTRNTQFERECNRTNTFYRLQGAAIGSSVMFEKLVVLQLGALLFANTHDHGTEWVKWGGIVVSIATVVVGVATGG